MPRIKVGSAIVVASVGLFLAQQQTEAGEPGASPETIASKPLQDLATDHVQLQILASSNIDMRTGARGIVVSLAPTGPMQARVRAGRITITHALDDAGTLLTQQTTNKFYSVSAGRIDDSMDLTSREPATFSLTGVSKDAKNIISILGVLELVVPDLDPNSAGTVAALPSRYGSQIVSGPLSAAGVTVTVFDKKAATTAAASKAPGGPQDYDAGPFFGASFPTPPGIPKPSMGDGDIAFAIDDPADRLIGIEIQAADGSPLSYNHGGNYHSSGLPGHPGRRFDTYYLKSPLPADARLAYWLLTPTAVLKIPFQIDKLPIPAAGSGTNEIGSAMVQVAAAASSTKGALEYEREHSNAQSTSATQTDTERLALLWADVPEYVSLIRGDTKYKELPKLRSSVPPVPATGTIFPRHGDVKVTVSFIVDATGNVEAARVLDSNDARFNNSAVTCVLQWKFIPGKTEAGPAMTNIVVPFVFNATKDDSPKGQ